MPAITASDLIFSEQANHNFSKTLGAIKRSTLSIHNRLRSIQEDAQFAESVAAAYGRPLVANERCGSWYINPGHKDGSAYFKSTDGHTGVWQFSSRRLNLHLLEIIGRSDGCIIVDSTRRGKRMPDALSKTIPIWCSVLNRLLFPDHQEFHDLYTPPQVVSKSEHAQIYSLLPVFSKALEELHISQEEVKVQISKPLRPVWVTPDSHLTPTGEVYSDFHPIICCTVSRKVAGGEVSEGGYIQGAGDDTENWAHGLTPPVFWANQELLLSTPEYDLPDLIDVLIRRAAINTGDGQKARCVEPTSCLFVAALPLPPLDTAEAGACIISLLPMSTEESTWLKSPTRLDVGLGPHKLGSRSLRSALPTIISFTESFLQRMEESIENEKRIILACDNGKDLSIGAALAILCLLFDGKGKLRRSASPKPRIDKNFIRRRLGWISTSKPDVNPSRSTLQSVNSFLMERH